MGILDRFSLDGRVAVVTGASSGLGVAFAQGLAEAGADVAIGARRVERLEDTAKLVEAAGQQCHAAPLDVTDAASIEAFTAGVQERFGSVHALINNAGVSDAAPATRQPMDDYRRVVAVNLDGVYAMSKAMQPLMTDGGAIVNVGSVLGETWGGIPQVGYSTTKSGIVGMTRDLSSQWSGRKRIRVMTLEPGFFPSEMSDELTDELKQGVLQMTPMGRFGDPAELAAAVVFLVSDAASYVTGSTLKVDGGMIGR